MYIVQKRALIILNMELNSYTVRPKHSRYVMRGITGRTINIMRGKTFQCAWGFQDLERLFLQEVQKVLLLTNLSIAQMIEVLENLLVLWREPK